MHTTDRHPRRGRPAFRSVRFAMLAVVLSLASSLVASTAGTLETMAPGRAPGIAQATVTAPPSRPSAPIDPAAVARAAATLSQLHSLLVSWRGDLVVEYYARGRRADRPANVKSVAKSLISALVGIAIDRGLIAGVREPIATFFPELLEGRDAARRAITIEDLLTMRSGLESTSGRNYGAWVRSRNWVRHALERPMVSQPGTSMEYSTGTSHLLSAILTRVSGKSTWQFAQDVLARPLGFTLARWPRDPQGIYFGGNDMLLTPRQMVAVGELYLNRGRVGDRQVVPAAWVDTSCVPRTRSRWDPDREYGYGWWMRAFAGQRACFAWGYGGQYIMVFPEIALVIAAASSTAVSDDRLDHRRRFFSLIEEHVVAPLGAVRGPAAGAKWGRDEFQFLPGAPPAWRLRVSRAAASRRSMSDFHRAA